VSAAHRPRRTDTRDVVPNCDFAAKVAILQLLGHDLNW
jgi:hypothetical protein